MREFKRVLIANRGEIAVRIIRALKTLEIESVAVFSDADATSMHVRMADKAYHLPGFFPTETYLVAPMIIGIAREAGCDAIHPGYGFLSESSEFSKLCTENSIKFVGPGPTTLELSGNKLQCKKIVEREGVPVIPYSREPIADAGEGEKIAAELGFPVLLKSAFGGGGRGIREVKNKAEVRDAFAASERESKTAFGRFALYIEKKLITPRHIEIQILASDDSAEFIHLGERECSIQRRYQKLIELSPSPVLDEENRKLIASYALRAAKAVKYSNAGTVEFLRDSSGQFYFIEINSRLQVEHPVTESVTGRDIVQSQLEIASGKKLPVRQRDVKLRGCAIECRINAEDPYSDFAPTAGTIEYLATPSGPGVRVDTALENGSQVSPYYDSLLAKLIVLGSNLEQARRRTLEALDEFVIYGVDTTLPFHKSALNTERFIHGDIDTGFVESSGRLSQRVIEDPTDEEFAVAAFLFARSRSPKNLFIQGKTPRPSWTKQNKERFVDAL